MAEVDIVVVNYRSARPLAGCLRSVHAVAKEDGVAVTVIVVNNGDDADIAANAGGAVVIENPSNLGFGVACNIGARAGQAPFVFFLNPDAELKLGCLAACLAFLRDPAHAAIGIVGPELSDEHGRLQRSCSEIPTAGDLLMRATGLHVLLGARANTPFLSHERHKQSGFVGQVMGAAMMVRRELFTRLGGFDERFFLYYEDLDLCARAAALGQRCYYLKSAHAMHAGRGSSSQDSGRALALYLRSALTYARLHFGRDMEVMLALWVVLVEFPLRLIQGLVQGRPARTLRAYGLLAGTLFGRPIVGPPW